MKQEAVEFHFHTCEHLKELNVVQVNLVEAAIDAAALAYAPYSRYQVGAALLLANGETITGNNQENAAYPSGLCAERVAIFYAASRYPDVAVTSLAIVAIHNGTIQAEPVTPCGGCRQVMCEAESRGGSGMEIILYGTGKILVIHRASDLLPLPFPLKTGNISILG